MLPYLCSGHYILVHYHPVGIHTSFTNSFYHFIGLRIGFYPVVFYVSEDAGNVSVCARIYESSGVIQDLNVSLRTSDSNGEEYLLNKNLIVT